MEATITYLSNKLDKVKIPDDYERAMQIAKDLDCLREAKGILQQHQTWVNLSSRGKVVEILIDYTNFLLKEGYCDTDVVNGHPTAVDQFLNTREIN